MRPSRAPAPDNWQFDRAWWDSEYLPAVALSFWAGVMWSLMALFASATWDLDQSWFDNSPTYLLPIRIALLWPVWGAVQLEDLLGWTSFGGTILLLFGLGLLPLMAVTMVWNWLSSRRGVAR